MTGLSGNLEDGIGDHGNQSYQGGLCFFYRTCRPSGPQWKANASDNDATSRVRLAGYGCMPSLLASSKPQILPRNPFHRRPLGGVDNGR